MSERQTNESTGLLGELHNLEQKIEHALHLDGAGNAAGGASSDQQSQGETSAQDALGSNDATEQGAGTATQGGANDWDPSDPFGHWQRCYGCGSTYHVDDGRAGLCGICCIDDSEPDW